MKILRYIYILSLTALLAACSTDSEGTEGTQQPGEDNMVTVGLRISAAGSNNGSTRAYSDSNADDAEMMNVWTVVAVHADGTDEGKVAFIHASNPATADREVDDLVDLPAGKYDFYSFANIAPSVVCQLMGISGFAKGTTVTRGNDDPTNNNEDPTNNNNPDNPDNKENEGDAITDYSEVALNDPFVAAETTSDDNNVYEITFDANQTIDASTIAAQEVGIDGNGFDITSTNVFAAKGIPMSNKQTITITEDTNVDLILVRMFAKIELRLYNETGADITVKSATLSDVNQNYANNIKMLPSLTHHDDMDAHHGDIRPNLGTTTYRDDYTCTPTTAVTVSSAKTYASGNYETIEFYVNESATPTNAEGLFYLTLEVDNAGTSEFRYALISNNAANEWNYIARNDYRIIPILLDDLKFEIIPYDFPPIGVYPVSVKEADVTNHIYDFEFHDYGHFHLLPVVTKGGGAVAFSATTPTSGTDYKWTLIDNDFSKSWFTYANFGDDTQTANPGSFYRTGSGSIIADGDDEGQTPVWYANDGTSGPQWDPAASGNYRPFVFGYIADPGSATKKQVYHEMKIQVYNGTTAYRQMLYRFYMTLSADQMLYSAAKGISFTRRSHSMVEK